MLMEYERSVRVYEFCHVLRLCCTSRSIGNWNHMEQEEKQTWMQALDFAYVLYLSYIRCERPRRGQSRVMPPVCMNAVSGAISGNISGDLVTLNGNKFLLDAKRSAYFAIRLQYLHKAVSVY